MLTQKARLLARFEEAGWRLLETEPEVLDWWADEILVFESDWSPRGRRLYLTFLVDPMWDGPRGQGQAVWAVAASRSAPRDLPSTRDGPLLSLGRGWERELDSFIESVNRLRFDE